MGVEARFEKSEWLRSNGNCGGGWRYGCRNQPYFNTASINVSQVHYDDFPEKKLSSATAISSIVHPHSPFAPSLHLHISWTEMRDGNSYWRIMADLNPSLSGEPVQPFKELFNFIEPELREFGFRQGDHYFDIPALKRKRGVSHFYLENYRSECSEKDSTLAQAVGEKVIRYYCERLNHVYSSEQSISERDMSDQLAYHTLYFFQVLTLDRGTTSGLLIHNENDVGILGSIPKFVNLDVLKTWLTEKPLPEIQATLMGELISTLAKSSTGSKIEIDDELKVALAGTVRRHYQQYPESLKYQASAFSRTSTVENHGS